MFSRVAWSQALILTVLCLVTFCLAFEVTPAQWTSPIHLDGDVLQACRLLKSSCLEGSYYQVRDLGAPFVADHYGFPETFVIHLPLVWLISRFSDNIYLVYNLLFVTTFLAVALASWAVMRQMGIAPWLAIGLSWIYAFLPNHVERYDHYGVALYATAPLMIYYGLLIYAGERPSWRLLLLAPLGGLCGPYPAAFGCLTVAMAGLLGSWKRSCWRPLVWSAGVCTLVTLAFLVVLWPSLKGGPDQAVLPFREHDDLPRWALYLDRLSLPAHARPNHPLAGVAGRYYSNLPAPEQPNESPYLGLICLVAWFSLLLGKWQHPRRDSLVVLSTALFALGMGGGLGQMLHLVIGTSIRCYNRLNYHLAFVLLLGLALRLSLRNWTRAQQVFFAVLLLAGLREQVLSTPVRDPSSIRAAVASDRQFVADLEKRLPARAMIWQFPYVAYPETRPAFAEGDYGLGRLYAVSKQLHWSWGCLKGNRQERTQAAFCRFPLQEQLELLKQTGFQGLVVERRGYADRGQDLEAQLQQNGLRAGLESPDKHLVFYPLAGQECPDPGPFFEGKIWEKTWNDGHIDFTESGWAPLYCRSGWGKAESIGTWTLGKRAWIFLPRLPGAPERAKVRLKVTPLILGGPQGLEIWQAGQKLGQWSLTQPSEQQIEFEAGFPASLELRISHPVQPSSLSKSQDRRPLGVLVRYLEVLP